MKIYKIAKKTNSRGNLVILLISDSPKDIL